MPRFAMIRERLAGKKVLLTGVTGFLGQAVLERLLRDLPDTHPVLLVRPGGRGGRRRVEELLPGESFAGLRERHGPDGLRRLLEERVEVLEGDMVADLPTLPPDLDVVVHCAASVSFDPPVDDAFRTNLLGTVGLYEGVRAAGGVPHLVHVSTAYVAGMTRGVIPEASLGHGIDWRAEADAALDARRQVEDASRRPEVLNRFITLARREHGKAGPQAVARAAEGRRRDWVTRRLVQYGRARAQSLGWPDAYSFTKALAEAAAEEVAGDLPLSIVRPSVIESALHHPFPGWIEGFKMAEPVILAYGRGSIPEFPGIPEGIVDLIPVDLVVNAILAVAASPPPEDAGRAYYHVSSGSRNPLRYRDLFGHVRDYFRRHPLPDPGRGEVRVPNWSFPGRLRVEKMLRAAERGVRAADRILARTPRSSRARSLARRLDRQHRRLEFVRRYADLYGAYAEIEVVYTDDRTVELWEGLPDEDRREFPFDAAAIDWYHYLQEVHCPSVTRVLRAATWRRPEPAVVITPRSDGVLAVFDLEGTILDSNVVEAYLWFQLAQLPREEWAGAVGRVARTLPRYLGAERRDRGEFLRSFYRRYEGASVEGLRRLVEERVGDLVLRRAAPRAIRRVREHRAAGHRTVLITGAIDVLVAPLAPLFDEIVTGKLAVTNGRYTGYLEGPPLVGEARAGWLRRFAEETASDLGASYGYADSYSDLPLLEAVGRPAAVNPDLALFREARRRRWPVEEWERVSGTPRVLVPEVVP
jgi:fatty acyl-CoA reductase